MNKIYPYAKVVSPESKGYPNGIVVWETQGIQEGKFLTRDGRLLRRIEFSKEVDLPNSTREAISWLKRFYFARRLNDEERSRLYPDDMFFHELKTR